MYTSQGVKYDIVHMRDQAFSKPVWLFTKTHPLTSFRAVLANGNFAPLTSIILKKVTLSINKTLIMTKEELYTP